MISPRRLWALLTARNKEFLRDRGALAWNLAFPFFAVFGMAFAFSGENQTLFKVGVAGFPPPESFRRVKHVEFVEFKAPEHGQDRLRRHQIDLLVQGEPGRPLKYWINASSPKGYIAERVLLGSLGGAKAERGVVTGRPIRYVDWLVSGLLAMNMMFSSLFGVGYVIVRYRKNGVLKRLKATPLRAVEFLIAQVLSRLLMAMAVFVVVYHGADAFLHFQRLGSLRDLYLVFGLGACCLISVGLLIAARVSSEELAGGLLNLLSWPMMFLSGVWFSLEGAPRALRIFADCLPLTHVIAAARAVMTEGATLGQVSGHLLVLSAMTVVFLSAGAFLFRWE